MPAVTATIAEDLFTRHSFRQLLVWILSNDHLGEYHSPALEENT